MDVWVEPSNETAKELVSAIDKYGFDATPLLDMDFTEILVFNVGEAPALIEIMNHVSGVEFKEAFNRKKELHIEGITLSLIHINDLRRNKLASGRHKDLNDLEHLPEE